MYTATADTYTAPIDVLIPPLYKQNAPSAVCADSTIVIDYGDAAPSSEGYSYVTNVSCAHAWMRSSTIEPTAAAVRNTKQALLSALFGVAGDIDDGGGADGGMVGARALPTPSLAEEVTTRVRDGLCDATHVTSPQIFTRMIALVLASRTDPARALVGCVTAIDLSYTYLGLVGKGGPPLQFDEDGNAILNVQETRKSNRGAEQGNAVRFFPDQRLPLSRTPRKIIKEVEQRSLALCYVAPLLFNPGGLKYDITHLLCTHCRFTDHDARALAVILRKGGDGGSSSSSSGKYKCSLKVVDLSSNRITDCGAEALKDSLKYNATVVQLTLTDNTGIKNRKKVLESIAKILRRNSKGKSSRPWYRRLL